MRTFITGGSGLLGHRIAELALEKSYEVYSGYCHNHPFAGKAIKIDLSNPVSIFEAIKEVKPDVIMHTAALTDVDGCEKDKELAFRINVEGTKAVAEAARKLNSSSSTSQRTTSSMAVRECTEKKTKQTR